MVASIAIMAFFCGSFVEALSHTTFPTPHDPTWGADQPNVPVIDTVTNQN